MRNRSGLTRRQMIMGAAPVIAAIPMAGLAAAPALSGVERGKGLAPDDHSALGHAAMIGDQVPAPGARASSTPLLYPPPALPHSPGRVRRYSLVAQDREIEVAKGVFYPAWTYNGTVPGPVIRATEDDILEVEFLNAGSHPHTIHFHGIHPSDMDGVFEIVQPGGRFTYRFPARPARHAALPLPRDAPQEAHPQGALRRVHHRPRRPARAGAGDRHGHERLRHRR